MSRNPLIAAVLAVALASPALADQLPPLHPTRDVAVTYAVAASQPGQPEQTRTLRMVWGDGGQKLRVEIGGQNTVALVDFATQRIRLLVGGGQKIVISAPFDPRLIPGFVMPEGVSARRIGSETVAGTGCELFALQGKTGDGRVCITGDGVVLRARGSAKQGSGTLEATSVGYGPQPASLFAVPDGYRRMDLKPPRR